MGDLTFWRILRGLVDGRVPLLAHDGTFPEDDMPSGSFTLTPAGMEVLAARADNIHLNGIDSWIGGVHPQPAAGTICWTGKWARSVDDPINRVIGAPAIA